MHLLKVTKFLVKIYQFKFLVYFLCKNCTPTPWKKSPLFPSNPPLEIEVLSSTTFLKIWVAGSTVSPSKKVGVHTMCKLFGQNSLILQEFVAQGNPRGDFR